jgi:uncharacterized iron-regulated protein
MRRRIDSSLASARARAPFASRRLAASVLFALGCSRGPSRPPAPQTPAPARWQSTLGVDHPLTGVIWDVTARRRVDEAELAARVRGADLVLVGETHDNPDHHRLQADLVRAFASSHDAPAVVFEMIDLRRQPAVDASLRAHPGDADALADAVDWASSGWPAWPIYRPVFEAALAAHATILAAGIDHDVAMRIAHEGPAALDPDLVRVFGLDAPLPGDQDEALRREMSDAHCGLLPESMLGPMVLVQRARDALLAERLHEGAGGHGALLIAGAGHVRRDRGVPAELVRVFGAKSLAIGLLQTNARDAAPDRYADAFGVPVLPFDVVWFTPRVDDVDHCDALRRHMGR